MRLMRVRLLKLFAFHLTAAWLFACAPHAMTGGDSSARYTYAPASVHIHSLSRFEVSSTGETVAVELWIEFLDGEGVTARGVGLLQASVVVDGRNPVVEILELDDRVANTKAFDRPLRMYRLAVPITPPISSTPQQRAAVTVTWIQPSGIRSVARATVPSSPE
jgi:hypothetical protein